MAQTADGIEITTNEPTSPISPLLLEKKSNDVDDTEKKNYRNKYILLAVIIVLILTAIILIIYFVAFEKKDESQLPTEKKDESQLPTDNYWEQKFLLIPSNDSTHQISRSLAFQPHVAGEKETLQLASIMVNMFADWGYHIIRDNISNVALDRYINSSLSIQLNNSSEPITIDLSNAYIPGDKDTNTSFRKRAWNSYSASANITYPLLYINNGADDDYQQLTAAGYNLSDGYIGLIKLGGSRGEKVYTAAQYGLKGLIVFTNQDNNANYSSADTYPNGKRLPESGFQYGTIKYAIPCVGNINPHRLAEQCKFNNSGDNYDKLFPSLYYNIPMITTGSKNAEIIFNYFLSQDNDNDIDGGCNYIDINNTEWSGWMPVVANVDVFCLGGNLKVNLITKNNFTENSKIQNLFAYRKGTLYPDEIVMVGAHRDAWALGACDDISGTTTMMEIARSISVMIDKGWTLKRSIMFGSWDGEEWGLFGSTHFNEQRLNWTDKIISYHNLDMVVQGGGNFVIMVTPLIEKLLIDAQKSVLYPYRQDNNDNKSTLYDYWTNGNPNRRAPGIGSLNSDYAAFAFYSGIESCDSGFWGDAFTYHTFYDVNGWLDIVDPQWKYSQHITQYAGLVTLRLLQNHIIPYNLSHLYVILDEWRTVNLPDYANKEDCDISTDPDHLDLLNDAINMFGQSIDIFYADLNTFTQKYGSALYSSKINSNSSDFDGEMLRSVEKFNNILTGLRTYWTLKFPEGLPKNYWFKNMLWRPGSVFPYIYDEIPDCFTDSITYGFNVTASMFYKASALLQSYNDS